MANELIKNTLEDCVSSSDLKKLPVLFQTLSFFDTAIQKPTQQNKKKQASPKKQFYKYI